MNNSKEIHLSYLGLRQLNWFTTTSKSIVQSKEIKKRKKNTVAVETNQDIKQDSWRRILNSSLNKRRSNDNIHRYDNHCRSIDRSIETKIFFTSLQVLKISYFERWKSERTLNKWVKRTLKWVVKEICLLRCTLSRQWMRLILIPKTDL
jgi:hypothetical protein